MLIASGVALSVLGFQQSQVWGWTNPATGLCIVAGLALLLVFYFASRAVTWAGSGGSHGP